jgi:hypothetical protein
MSIDAEKVFDKIKSRWALAVHLWKGGPSASVKTGSSGWGHSKVRCEAQGWIPSMGKKKENRKQ